jgi:hypothetical protein
MEMYNLIVIGLFLTILFISGILYWIVHQHISKKALIDQTIIDLTYKECLIYIFFLAISLGIAFISCMLANENSLELLLAILLSDVVVFFIDATSNYLSIGCILRILTMINNSEQQGLQLLGPDDRAIIKIRIFSTACSLSTIIFGNLILNSFPPILGTLIGNQNLSTSSGFKNDPAAMIYYISPTVAAALVILTNIVSN